MFLFAANKCVIYIRECRTKSRIKNVLTSLNDSTYFFFFARFVRWMCHGTNWAKKILVASWCETRIGFCQLRVELYDSNLKWMATYDVDESPNSERTQHRMKSKNDFLIYFVFYCVVAYLVPSPLWHLYVLKWKACNKLITADQIFTPFGKNSIQTGIYVIYSATSCYCTQAAGKQRTHHAPCVPMKWIPFGCVCVFANS